MDSELKIVAGIIVAIIFLSSTGIGIWIYRIMKASERVKEIDVEIKEFKTEISNEIKELRKDVDTFCKDFEKKISDEREARTLLKSEFKNAERTIDSLIHNQDKMFSRFIETTQKFENIATRLNTTMEHLDKNMSAMQKDIKDMHRVIHHIK